MYHQAQDKWVRQEGNINIGIYILVLGKEIIRHGIITHFSYATTGWYQCHRWLQHASIHSFMDIKCHFWSMHPSHLIRYQSHIICKSRQIQHQWTHSQEPANNLTCHHPANSPAQAKMTNWTVRTNLPQLLLQQQGNHRWIVNRHHLHSCLDLTSQGHTQRPNGTNILNAWHIRRLELLTNLDRYMGILELTAEAYKDQLSMFHRQRTELEAGRLTRDLFH